MTPHHADRLPARAGLRPSGRLSRFAAAVLAVAVAIGPAASPAHAQPVQLEDLATFPRTTLEVESGGRRHAFSVWIADSPDRQAQGLMFVRELPADQGMLFPQSRPRPVAFWMKNTFIPLDMVFIDRDWRILRIAKMTKPQSLDVVPSGGPVVAVLELRGGEADRRGFRKGDRIRVNHSP